MTKWRFDGLPVTRVNILASASQSDLLPFFQGKEYQGGQTRRNKKKSCLSMRQLF